MCHVIDTLFPQSSRFSMKAKISLTVFRDMNNCTVHTAFRLLQLAMPYTHVFVGDAQAETGKKMMPPFFIRKKNTAFSSLTMHNSPANSSTVKSNTTQRFALNCLIYLYTFTVSLTSSTVTSTSWLKRKQKLVLPLATRITDLITAKYQTSLIHRAKPLLRFSFQTCIHRPQ